MNVKLNAFVIVASLGALTAYAASAGASTTGLESNTVEIGKNGGAPDLDRVADNLKRKLPKVQNHSDANENGVESETHESSASDKEASSADDDSSNAGDHSSKGGDDQSSHDGDEDDSSHDSGDEHSSNDHDD